MSGPRTSESASAARHPAIAALATAFLVVPVSAVLLAAALLFDLLSRPMPVFEKILWTLFLAGAGLVVFLLGWYLSLLGHAVAELAAERATTEGRA